MSSTSLLYPRNPLSLYSYTVCPFPHQGFHGNLTSPSPPFPPSCQRLLFLRPGGEVSQVPHPPSPLRERERNMLKTYMVSGEACRCSLVIWSNAVSVVSGLWCCVHSDTLCPVGGLVRSQTHQPLQLFHWTHYYREWGRGTNVPFSHKPSTCCQLRGAMETLPECRGVF